MGSLAWTACHGAKGEAWYAWPRFDRRRFFAHWVAAERGLKSDPTDPGRAIGGVGIERKRGWEPVSAQIDLLQMFSFPYVTEKL